MEKRYNDVIDGLKKGLQLPIAFGIMTIITMFLAGWIYYWYNHVLFQFNITYLQCVGITLVVFVTALSSKETCAIIHWFGILLFTVSIFGQAFHWIFGVTLPLIHLN